MSTHKYLDETGLGQVWGKIKNLTSTVEQLTDTTISSLSNGQVLMYNSTTSKWENTSLPHITYSVSMSSNVITLTGSDGSTSSVTLPIYTGGVT